MKTTLSVCGAAVLLALTAVSNAETITRYDFQYDFGEFCT